jgi:hypothetical protein
LKKHAVSLAIEVGLDRVSNGALLKAAESAGFEIIVTSDRNIRHQQNLKSRKIAIVILPSGRWPLVAPQILEVVAAVDLAHPGSYWEIALRPAS